MVTGYYFNTEKDAMDAVASVNTYYGCPMEGVETWCGYQAWGDGWAIMADASLVDVLGQPQVLPELPDTEPLDE
jgi:hypothetical protein